MNYFTQKCKIILYLYQIAKNMINKRKFAVLYYSIIDNKDYDIEDKNTLKKLGKRFDNSPVPKNSEILKQAISKYNELLAKEFDEIIDAVTEQKMNEYAIRVSNELG